MKGKDKGGTVPFVRNIINRNTVKDKSPPKREQNQEVRRKVKVLVDKFNLHRNYYLSKGYLEAQVREDFINPLFEALDWDVRNTKGLSPYEREVLVEKGETKGTPDYSFRISGQTKFFVEAKAPHEPLHNVRHILQAKSYAWNTKEVFIVLLTDFEEFRLYDASIRPDSKNPDQGLIFELTYDKYLDNLDKLLLLSKEEVEKGSLDRLLLKDALSKRLRVPVDKAFLDDLSKYREELAKDIYKQNQQSFKEGDKIQVKLLNEAVQKLLDRLIFIRIAEDRKIIEPKSLLDEVEWWKAGGKRRSLQERLKIRFAQWNADFNGEILKPGACDVFEVSSGLLAQIIEGLYYPKCPYRFDVIGVELLGSIYERYLGKTIRATPQRVKIEEKPEVRKAGGVYYTPKYIVDYIVKNTVGKMIKGKTPDEIRKIKILDPACGSGSFLLSAYQTLIDYYLKYYEEHPGEIKQGKLFLDVITDYEGRKRLSIEKKTEILSNNIYGVDIDPQAVEVAMMSLYLKCLEGEKDLPRKKELLPSLSKNIRCGNSLISYDIFDQGELFTDEEKERINPFDWYSNTTGFGEIMEQGGFDVVIGNPPYVAHQIEKFEKEYLKKKYAESIYGRLNLYALFIHRSVQVLKNGGLFGFINPKTYLTDSYFKKLRNFIQERFKLIEILDIRDRRSTFEGVLQAVTLLFLQKKEQKKPYIISLKQVEKATGILENNIGELRVNSKDFFLLKKSINAFLFSIFPETYSIFSKIYKKVVFLPQISGGAKTGSIQWDLYKKYFSSEKEGNCRLIWAENIQRYYLQKSSKRAGKEWLNLPPKFEEQFKKNTKILATQRVTSIEQPRRIIATLVNLGEGNFLFENHINVIESDIDRLYQPEYILGIVASKLFDFIFRAISSNTQVSAGQLNSLPLSTIDFNNPEEKAMHDKMVKLVDRMLELQKKKHILPISSQREKIEREIAHTDEKIDELVYQLYGITEKERRIIEEGK